MPEDDKSTNVDTEQKDVVSREDYNKIVENANSTKTELDKLKADIEAKNKETATATEKTAQEQLDEQKTAWEKEREEKDKVIEDLKKQAEAKPDDTKVSKGLVKEPESADKEEQVRTELEKQLGKLPEVNPNNFANVWAKYGHYKDPKTRTFTQEQFGKALSLHAGAIAADHINLNANQRGSKVSANDVVIPRTYGNDLTD